MGELIAKIENVNGILVVSSRVIAKQLGKKHKNVIRDIENLIGSNMSLLKNQSTEVSVD